MQIRNLNIYTSSIFGLNPKHTETVLANLSQTDREKYLGTMNGEAQSRDEKIQALQEMQTTLQQEIRNLPEGYQQIGEKIATHIETLLTQITTQETPDDAIKQTVIELLLSLPEDIRGTGTLEPHNFVLQTQYILESIETLS